MIVAMRYPVKTARPIAELYLGNMALLLQVTKRVVDGRERYGRQFLFRMCIHVIRSQVLVRRTYHPQDDLALPC
jgi:hypothetical protein